MTLKLCQDRVLNLWKNHTGIVHQKLVSDPFLILVKCMKITRKIKIPEGVKKEAQLLYLHEIVSLVEEHSVPNTPVMNLD